MLYKIIANNNTIKLKIVYFCRSDDNFTNIDFFAKNYFAKKLQKSWLLCTMHNVSRKNLRKKPYLQKKQILQFWLNWHLINNLWMKKDHHDRMF